VGERVRKERSDKKIDLKPSIDSTLKESIARISYITDTPIKDVAATLIHQGLLSRKILDQLSVHFRRPLRINNTIFTGDLERISLRTTRAKDPLVRVTTRISKHTYENLSSLAYSLDVEPGRAAALLLSTAIRDSELVNIYIRNYVKDHLDERRMAELKKVLRYINYNNPYEEKVSWFVFLSDIYNQLKTGKSSLAETADLFLHKWRD